MENIESIDLVNISTKINIYMEHIDIFEHLFDLFEWLADLFKRLRIFSKIGWKLMNNWLTFTTNCWNVLKKKWNLVVLLQNLGFSNFRSHKGYKKLVTDNLFTICRKLLRVTNRSKMFFIRKQSSLLQRANSFNRSFIRSKLSCESNFRVFFL